MEVVIAVDGNYPNSFLIHNEDRESNAWKKFIGSSAPVQLQSEK